GDAEVMRRGEVAPAADADHRGFADAGQPIGEVDQVVLQEGEGIPRAVVVVHIRTRRAVDVEPDLGDTEIRRQFRRGPPQRWYDDLRLAPGDDARIRIPFFVDIEPGALEEVLYQDRPDADWNQRIDDRKRGKRDDKRGRPAPQRP